MQATLTIAQQTRLAVLVMAASFLLLRDGLRAATRAEATAARAFLHLVVTLICVATMIATLVMVTLISSDSVGSVVPVQRCLSSATCTPAR